MRVKSNENDQEEIQIKKMSIRIQEIIKEVFISSTRYEEIIALEVMQKVEQEYEQKGNCVLKNGLAIPQNRGIGSVKESSGKILHDVIETYKENEKDSIYENDQTNQRHRISSTLSKFQDNGLVGQLSKQGTTVEREINGLYQHGEDISDSSSVKEDTKIVNCISPRDINNYFSSPELIEELKNLTMFNYSNRPNNDQSQQNPLNFSSRNNFNQGYDKSRREGEQVEKVNQIQVLQNINEINSNQGENIRSNQKFDQESSNPDSPNRVSKPVYYQMYKGYILDINSLINCQKMMNCISIQDELIKILIQVSQATTLAKKENKNQLIYDCLALLNYFILKNNQNQTYLLKNIQFLEEHNGLLKKLIQHTDIQIIELTFLLLKNIYCGNYKILLEIDKKEQHDLFQRLAKKFQESFKRKLNSFCILFIQFLPYLFKLQGKTLIQNQQFVIKQLIEHQVDLNQYIFHFANKALDSKIPKQDWMIGGEFNIHGSPPSIKPRKQQAQDIEISTLNTVSLMPLNDNQIKEIQIGEDIIFLISFLRTFRQIAKNSSSYVNNYIRSLFTIKQISDLIQELDNWWPLKLELLLYLTESYLNQNKIEETETVELINLFSVVLAEEMYKYELHLSQKNNYVYNIQFTTDIPNVFNETHVGTFPNQPYIQVSYDESYDQYIVLGILRSLRYFIYKQPENPDDQFLGILSQYQESIEDIQEFMSGPQTEKQFTVRKRRSDRKKTHRRSSQFFTLEVSPAKNNIQSFSDDKLSHQIGQQQILMRDVTILLDSIIKKEYMQELNVKRFRQTIDQKEQTNSFIRQQQMLHAKIVPEIDVQLHHTNELNNLTELVIDLKTKNNNEFLRTLKEYLNVVSNVKEVSPETRSNTLKILRNISNFKKFPQLYDLIQIDLCQIGFMSFLCDAVVSEVNPQIKSLYIEGLVDFLDESNTLISDSFFDYMNNDESNQFMFILKDFLSDNFKQYQEYQKTQIDKVENKVAIMEDWNAFQAVYQSSIQSQIQQEEYQNAIRAKLDKCNAIMQLIKLCCENHCLKFQNFFRIQLNKSSKEKKNSINMVTLITDIFAKFVKRIDKSNLSFGISILETLISLVDGPCIENQRELVSSKILENIEDLMLEIFDKEIDSEYPKHTLMNFKNKIIEISLSLFQGCGDTYIINKVGQFINPSILYQQMYLFYEDYANSIQLIRNKHKGVYLDYIDKILPQSLQLQIQTIDSAQSLKRYVVDKYGNTPLAQKNEEMILVIFKKAQQFLKFSQDCLSLIKNLRFQNDQFKLKCIEEKKKLSPMILKSYQNLKQTYKSIEIVNQFGRLQRVFFPCHTITRYLSSTKQQRFLEDVNRDSANEKIQGLLSMENQFMDEMKHFLFLNARGLYFKLSVLQNFKTTHLIIIIITNLFVLTGLDYNQKVAEGIIGFIQLISSSCIWLLWAVMELPLDYISATRVYGKTQLLKLQSQQKEKQKNKKFFIFRKLIRESHMLYLSLNVLFSILGMQFSKIFYTLLMIDIIDKSPVLRNVISAVTKNSKQLLLTGLLGCILLVFYSTIAYYSYLSATIIYKDDETLPICHSPFDCFLFMAGQGLRQGGGVGDIIKMPNPYDYTNYFSRFLFDLTFYLLINVLWLNIIFGIIVDSFAELRDAKKEKDKDQEFKCYICHMDRDKFENEGMSFEKHRLKEHQLWNYMFYIIHLKLKDHNKFNGTESYVHSKIEKDDITWFPIGKSIKLLKIQGENLFSQEQKLQNSIDKLQEKFSVIEKQMMNFKN